MASYYKDSFTISLQDYALNKGKMPADFELETIVVQEKSPTDAITDFNKKAESYKAVVGMQEGGWNNDTGTAKIPQYYFIRGTGVKARKTEPK